MAENMVMLIYYTLINIHFYHDNLHLKNVKSLSLTFLADPLSDHFIAQP